MTATIDSVQQARDTIENYITKSNARYPVISGMHSVGFVVSAVFTAASFYHPLSLGIRAGVAVTNLGLAIIKEYNRQVLTPKEKDQYFYERIIDQVLLLLIPAGCLISRFNTLSIVGGVALSVIWAVSHYFYKEQKTQEVTNLREFLNRYPPCNGKLPETREEAQAFLNSPASELLPRGFDLRGMKYLSSVPDSIKGACRMVGTSISYMNEQRLNKAREILKA